MNKFVVAFALLAISFIMGAPSDVTEKESLRSLPALQHEVTQDDFGQYALRYVTAEGIIVSERGRLVPSADGKGHVMITEGEVTYIGDDGKTYVTRFSAGLDGFKPEGAHLPIAPEPIAVPESVLLAQPVVVVV